jgi:hypothetical protein
MLIQKIKPHTKKKKRINSLTKIKYISNFLKKFWNIGAVNKTSQ